MRKALHIGAALIAAFLITVGGAAIAQPAGATMQYVNQMPVTFGTEICYRDDTVVNGLRHYECDLYSAGSGAYIRNDASWWADPTFCDTLTMVWDPNGWDYVDIRNGDISTDPTDPSDGYYNPKGCGTGIVGSGSQGMSLVHYPQGGSGAYTCCLHGGQFLHYSVGGAGTVCLGLYYPYNCGGGWNWHYRVHWG